MRNVTESGSFNERINDFVQKNRKGIFISLGILVLFFAGIVVSISLMNIFRNRAIRTVEDFSDRYENLLPQITPASLTEEASSNEDATEVETFISEIEGFAKKTSGYAGGRAWAIIASINSTKEEWADAEAAWVNAAKAAKKTYLEPVAWYNAAACAEELEKNTEALEHYSKCLSSDAVFPAAVQAQFSIGRLREITGDREGAIEAYRYLIATWAQDAIWANLANSRVVALEVQSPL